MLLKTKRTISIFYYIGAMQIPFILVDATNYLNWATLLFAIYLSDGLIRREAKICLKKDKE